MPELTRDEGPEPDWLYDRTEVTLTVQDIANRLHQDIYGPDSEHSGLHSCPCFLRARWFLGLEPKPNLYWPDGRGGNAHEPHPDPRIEFYRLKDAVVSAAKAYGRAARAVEDHMNKPNEEDGDSTAGWQLLRDMESTQEDLMLQAVWPLIDFEAERGIGET